MRSNEEIKRYLLTWGDLSNAQEFGREYLKRELYAAPLSLDARAYATALVVSYVRPFSRNRDNGERVDVGFLVSGLDEEQQRLHTEILAARNQIFAHTDASAHHYERQGDAGSRYLARRDVRRPPARETVERLLECVAVMKEKLIPLVREAEGWGGDAE